MCPRTSGQECMYILLRVTCVRPSFGLHLRDSHPFRIIYTFNALMFGVALTFAMENFTDILGHILKWHSVSAFIATVDDSRRTVCMPATLKGLIVFLLDAVREHGTTYGSAPTSGSKNVICRRCGRVHVVHCLAWRVTLYKVSGKNYSGT